MVMDVKPSRIEQMADALEYMLVGRWTRPNPPPWGIAGPGVKPLSSGRQWRSATYISIEQAVEALQVRWTSADAEEARQAFALLEGYAVRKTSKLGVSYKILRPIPTPPVFTGPKPRPLPKGEGIHDHWRKIKPGTCKKCGVKVQNPNRHNNPLHTGDECRFNVVKGILEE